MILSFGVDEVSVFMSCTLQKCYCPNSSSICSILDQCPLYGTLDNLGYPNHLKFAHYHNQWKGREDFKKKGLEDIEQC
jgi:hypothetical protein